MSNVPTCCSRCRVHRRNCRIGAGRALDDRRPSTAPLPVVNFRAGSTSAAHWSLHVWRIRFPVRADRPGWTMTLPQTAHVAGSYQMFPSRRGVPLLLKSSLTTLDVLDAAFPFSSRPGKGEAPTPLLCFFLNFLQLTLLGVGAAAKIATTRAATGSAPRPRIKPRGDASPRGVRGAKRNELQPDSRSRLYISVSSYSGLSVIDFTRNARWDARPASRCSSCHAASAHASQHVPQMRTSRPLGNRCRP